MKSPLKRPAMSQPAIGETLMMQTRGEPLLHLLQPPLRSPAITVLQGLAKLSPRREGIGFWDGSEPAPTSLDNSPHTLLKHLMKRPIRAVPSLAARAVKVG